MALASDGQGNYLSLGDDGQWTPATRAKNPETGVEMVLDGKEWKTTADIAKADPANSSTLGAAARGVVRGVTAGFADEIRGGVAGIGGALSGEGFTPAYERERDASRAQFAADDTQHSAAGIVGQLYGGVGGGLATRGLSLVGRLNPLLASTAGGAAGGAVTGFGEGEGGLGPRLQGAAMGAGVGAGAGAVLHGAVGAANLLRNPIKPHLSPEAQALRTGAQAEGIPLSVGQETGSKFMQNVDSQLAQLPGSAGRAADDIEAQRRAFNTAAWKRAGETYDIAGPTQLNASRARSGGEIGRIANSYDLDASPPQFLNDLVASSDRARGFAASDVERQTVSRIDDIVGKVQAGDIIPGGAYRELRSELTETMRGTDNGDLRRHLGKVLNTLDDAFANSIPPAEKAAFDTARREYANLHVIADAVGKAGEGSALGHISPVRLAGAVDQSTGGGFAWGKGDLNELAHLGQGVLRQPPDSGTAGRSLANNVLTGSLPAAGAVAGFVGGGIPGAVAGAAAPFVIPNLAHRLINGPGRNWLINGLGPIDPRLTNAGAVAAGSTAERNRLLQD